MHDFPTGISTIWNFKHPCPGFELDSPRSFPTMVAITLRVLFHLLSLSLSIYLSIYLYVCIYMCVFERACVYVWV